VLVMLCSHLGTDGPARAAWPILRLLQALSLAGLLGLALLVCRRRQRGKKPGA